MPKNLYVLYGADEFSRGEALREIKRGLGEPESLSLNTVVLDGRQLTLEQLHNACYALPFLAPSRLVIVEGLLPRFEPKAPGKEKASQEKEGQALADCICQIPPTTMLIFLEGEIKGDNPLLRLLVSSGAVAKIFPRPRSGEVFSWVRQRVVEKGGDISPPAIRLLTELVGDNLGILASEIDKLLVYVSGRRIEDKDVREAVAYVKEVNIFAMADAVLEGHPGPALRQMHQLWQEGAAAPYLLAMLTRQLRLILQAKDLEKLSPEEMRRRLRVSARYPVDKLLRQARGYSPQRVLEVYRQILETDIAIKTGKEKDEVALDLLVVRLCQGSPPSP